MVSGHRKIARHEDKVVAAYNFGPVGFDLGDVVAPASRESLAALRACE
jgi:hypothetical protein